LFETLELVRLMSYVVFSVSSAILLYFLLCYVRFVLADTYRHGWWLLGTATGAGIIYGLAGVLHGYGGIPAADSFRKGASLFFILFLALGIRAIARLEEPEGADRRSYAVDYGFDFLVVSLFVIGWWVSFALRRPSWLPVVEAVGWVVMLGFALYYGIVAVRKHEGTSLASVVRHLLPAVICFGGVVLVEVYYRLTGQWVHVAESVWIVGMVLVSAFLFNTATTIRQEQAELERIYDRTTWPEN
jgi:hypothetical protein